MALEFVICERSIEKNKKIVIPRCANIYEIDDSNNKIRFSYSNPGSNGRLGVWKVPFKAREMDFQFQADGIGGYVIIPKFYGHNEKLLKTGNR